MGKSLKVDKPKKRKPQVVNVMEDDEFSLKDEQPEEPTVVKTEASMKKLMEDVLEVAAEQKTPFLSSFKKPLEKLQQEKSESRQNARTKKIAKTSSTEDKAFRYVGNAKLEKQLRSLTMKGVAKLMNIIDSYRRTHPEEE